MGIEKVIHVVKKIEGEESWIVVQLDGDTVKEIYGIFDTLHEANCFVRVVDKEPLSFFEKNRLEY